MLLQPACAEMREGETDLPSKSDGVGCGRLGHVSGGRREAPPQQRFAAGCSLGKAQSSRKEEGDV